MSHRGTKARSPAPRRQDDWEEEKPSWMVPGSPDYLAVKIAVIEARCPQRTDKKGKIVGDPDTYVRLTYYGQEFETQVMRNNVAPKWNQTFEIPIPLGAQLPPFVCHQELRRGAGNQDRRNALGEVEIRVWDIVDKKKENFMGEVRLPLGTHWLLPSVAYLMSVVLNSEWARTGDYGGVNYEYVEPRRYKLKGGPAVKTTRGDNADGRITLRVGMVLPKKKKFEWDESKGERTTESLYVRNQSPVSWFVPDQDHAYRVQHRRVRERCRRFARQRNAIAGME